MAKERILVIEDEDDLLRLVSFNLTREGYQVTCAPSGEEGMRLARLEQPQLVLLDLMLPGIDGFGVCRILKQEEKTRHIPIVMLTAKGEEPDIVTGLELGAEDYITKPFKPKVLIARIRALFRRLEAHHDDAVPLVYRNLLIHPGRLEVLHDGQRIDLTVSEFKILALMAQRPGWVFTRGQIVDALHGDDYAVTERTVDVHIVSLRKKLGDAGQGIETIRGVGYRMKD